MLQLEDHPVFKRASNDLYVELKISLKDALCGFRYALTHLDGRSLLIESYPGDVTMPCRSPDPSSPSALLISRLLPVRPEINSRPSQNPDHYKLIEDEGMPEHRMPFLKGQLFILFTVVFPSREFLTPERCRSLEKVLPPGALPAPSQADLDKCEKKVLHSVEVQAVQWRQQQQREACSYDDYYGDESAHSHPQCPQQ